MADYASFFSDVLIDALVDATRRVHDAESRLPEAEREDAWHLLSYAFDQDVAWQETRQLVFALAPRMELAGFREDWINYLQTAASRGADHNDLAATAEFEYQTGLLYRMLTDYERAKSWLNSSRERFALLGDRGGQARVLNELAWIEQLRRNYDAATEHVEHALPLLDESAPERGMCYRVQGMIAIYQGHWEQAERYHRKALAIFEQHGDVRKVAWSMVNLAVAQLGQKKLEESITNCSQACALMHQMGDEYHLAIAQMNLGLAYYHSHKFDDAVGCYLKSESIMVRFHDLLRLAEVHLNLALAHLAQDHNELASVSFEYAIHLFKKSGVISQVINAMDGLAMSYMAQSCFDKALTILTDAISMLPQIVNAPNYQYYNQSLNKHLEEATFQQRIAHVPRADVA